MIRRARSLSRSHQALTGLTLVLIGAVVTAGLLWRPSPLSGLTLPVPTRSTTIAMTTDDTRLVVVNRETNSVSVIQVRARVFGVPLDIPPVKLGEVAVGQEPRCVALNPDNTEAWVTNAASGTVSVVSLAGSPSASTGWPAVVAEIPVRGEPWGCAMTPNGTSLFVADHTDGSVIEIDPATRTIRRTIPVGGNPAAIAITNDGDTVDTDETVFVSQFFAEPVPGGPGEGFDTGKRGVVQAFQVGSTAVTRIALPPFADVGFTANRTNFCPQSAPNPALLQSTVFCPDLSAPAGSPIITQNPQGAFPNQLHALLIRGIRLYVPSIGAQPSPPVQFSVNVQALLHVVNVVTLSVIPGESGNVNNLARLEPAPPDPAALTGLFLNDLVDIEANAAGTLLCGISRGANQLVCGTQGSTTLTRFQTGNIPNGVVFSADGTRAYVNNEVNVSVTIIDLAARTVLARDIPSGTPPAPGTPEHAVLVGKLAFFTALGMPNNGVFDIPIRDFNPLQFRGKQSNNAWSTCASCHPDGLSDNVTWIFANGPRSTSPLDGAHSKHNIADQRVYLWSAARGSNTDFNNNSRNVQGGIGFADNPNRVYDHGPVFGVSDALDAQTLWVASVRSRRQPAPVDPNAVTRGATLFAVSCSACHGGPKWTKSTILYGDNPAFNRNPAAGGVPIDPGVVNAGAQIVSYTRAGVAFRYLEDVGTFAATSPIEIAANGQRALGALGFNVPSLLSLGATAPYLHHGAAQTLADVFPLHTLGAGTIQSSFDAGQRADLLAFLRSIDGRTDTFRSAANDFIDELSRP